MGLLIVLSRFPADMTARLMMTRLYPRTFDSSAWHTSILGFGVFTVDRGTVDEAKPKLTKSKGFSVNGPGFAFGNDGFV